MYTILETPTFTRLASSIWSDEELDDFIHWLANNPLAGNVIPRCGGLRKVCWGREGAGKRGGTRVIYYNALSDGLICPLMVYTKANFDNLPLVFLQQLKEQFDG